MIDAHRILRLKSKFISGVTVARFHPHPTNNLLFTIIQCPQRTSQAIPILGKIPNIFFRCTLSCCNSIGNRYDWKAAEYSKEKDTYHPDAKYYKGHIKC